MSKLYEDLKTLQKKFHNVKNKDIEYIFTSGYNICQANYTDKILRTLKELGDTKEGNVFLNKVRDVLFEETTMIV